MKNSLDHLYKNGDYSNALKTLRHLEQSLVETRENARRLALQLARGAAGVPRTADFLRAGSYC